MPVSTSARSRWIKDRQSVCSTLSAFPSSLLLLCLLVCARAHVRSTDKSEASVRGFCQRRKLSLGSDWSTAPVKLERFPAFPESNETPCPVPMQLNCSTIALAFGSELKSFFFFQGHCNYANFEFISVKGSQKKRVNDTHKVW